MVVSSATKNNVFIFNEISLMLFSSNRVLKFLQTLRVVQNNEPIRDKLKLYREAYNYGTEMGMGMGEDENLVNSVCSEFRYPCRNTQKSLQRNTRMLVDLAPFWYPSSPSVAHRSRCLHFVHTITTDENNSNGYSHKIKRPRRPIIPFEHIIHVF